MTASADTQQPVTLHQKRFYELTLDELYALLRARCEVFVVEQNCSYQDMDNNDQTALHLWLTVGDEIVAVCRVRPAGGQLRHVSIGRVITTEHGKGYGEAIMRHAMEVAKTELGATRIDIEAQRYAKGFYERFGFRQTTEPYILEGLAHIGMTWIMEKI